VGQVCYSLGCPSDKVMGCCNDGPGEADTMRREGGRKEEKVEDGRAIRG